jgi:HEAT repeat protein
VITVAELAQALLEADPFIRAEAVADVVPETAACEVLGIALRDDFPLVRREAVRTLGRIGGKEATRALSDSAAHDPSAEVREEAVAVMARMLLQGRRERGTGS